ncbi:unnamed protein product [Arabidopsis thaliana]|uniref:Defensin-like domain-containing protein n=2 Tax=Arabidopsis TaxID=3701 RepID=A0A5S9VUI4_ARATH|nr:hypothetical protein ISN44_As01g024490 [Arabidopsis suecica]CAA0238246.1 unnamed protein product [Arabidopsis thaliana]VYS47054.1 unnamed protein product [Arabidopsis thaliana]
MGSSKLLVALTLVVMITISYDLFSEIGISAATLVIPTCFENCNATFQDPECNKWCALLAYKDGSCLYPPSEVDDLPPIKRPYIPRCCCNPITLSPASP